MPKDISSKIRTLKKDMTRLQRGDFVLSAKAETNNKPEAPKTKDNKSYKPDNYSKKSPHLNNKKLARIKTYKKQTIEDKKELILLFQKTKAEIQKINTQLVNLKKSTDNDREYRKKRRKLFKEKRQVEKAQIKINKKIEEADQNIKKLSNVENKIVNNNPSS